MNQPLLIAIRGGGDLASGVALRLFRSGMPVIISELAQPLAVRRMVSFAQAVYSQEITVEGVVAKLAADEQQARLDLELGFLPVLIDPDLIIVNKLEPTIIIDGRMTKNGQSYELGDRFPFVIGLGPGFEVNSNCNAIVETKRGHNLGRVFWKGQAEPDTKMPESVGIFQEERVLRAPIAGIFHGGRQIGDVVRKNELIASVDEKPICAQFDGVVRGLINDGIHVERQMKIGDLDPRLDPKLCFLVSDKALAVGGGVLEAIMSVPALRSRICRGVTG